MRPERQNLAVPHPIPVVAWDPTRGVFLIGEHNPDFAAVRARYERLLQSPAPIVQFPRRTWADRWRRVIRDLRLAAAVFLGQI